MPSEQQRSSGASRSTQFRSTPAPAGPAANKPKPKPRDPDEEVDPDAEEQFKCPKGEGLYADPASCKKFYLCGAWKAYHQACPPSLYFDDKLKFCTFKSAELKCGPLDEVETDEENAKLNQENLTTCDKAKCQLPNCFCSDDGTQVPGKNNHIQLRSSRDTICRRFQGRHYTDRCRTSDEFRPFNSACLNTSNINSNSYLQHL